jgi:uncharacterized coiled-coil protein SlyX
MDGRRLTDDELLIENAALRERVAELESRNAELESRNAELESGNGELEGQVAQLTARVKLLLKWQAELLQRLEEKERSGKRQAAPFSKGPPKPAPQPPERKAGDDYGRHHRRAIPEQPPDEIDDGPLPARCRKCAAQCPKCHSTHLVDEITQPSSSGSAGQSTGNPRAIRG